MCANSFTQSVYISRQEMTSMTTALETIITTWVIDANKKREMMALDTPNEFVQTEVALDEYNIIMKIRVQWWDILIEISSGVYGKYAWYKGK